MHIPLISLDRVFHVGTMVAKNIGLNSGNYSQEGHNLSVSLCPEAWVEIARLGGNNLFELSRESAFFLDIHAVQKDNALLPVIFEWAKAEGLVEEAVLWRAWQNDDDGNWVFSLHASRAEAQEEVSEMDDDEDTGPDGKPLVEDIRTAIGTPALQALTGMSCDANTDATDTVICAWASQVLPGLLGRPVDGLWWNENFDPDALSAPRGCIFPERISEWTSSAVEWSAFEGDDETMDGMPETQSLPPGAGLPLRHRV